MRDKDGVICLGCTSLLVCTNHLAVAIFKNRDAEREECAKIADAHIARLESHSDQDEIRGAQQIASAIRARARAGIILSEEHSHR